MAKLRYIDLTSNEKALLAHTGLKPIEFEQLELLRFRLFRVNGAAASMAFHAHCLSTKINLAAPGEGVAVRATDGNSKTDRTDHQHWRPRQQRLFRVRYFGEAIRAVGTTALVRKYAWTWPGRVREATGCGGDGARVIIIQK